MTVQFHRSAPFDESNSQWHKIPAYPLIADHVLKKSAPGRIRKDHNEGVVVDDVCSYVMRFFLFQNFNTDCIFLSGGLQVHVFGHQLYAEQFLVTSST
jgi:hypothetical protein